MAASYTLDRLEPGAPAIIAGFGEDHDGLLAKLREIGFAEGDEVELLTRGWLGGSPLCVRLNRTLIALRRREARLIVVEPGR